MSIKYNVIQRRNPSKPEEPQKYYAVVASDGEMDIAQLVKQIEKFSALSEADIRGVIIALENVIQDALAAGKIVRLDKLGLLYATLSSGAADTEKDFHSGLIKKVGVNYRPGKRILDSMKAAGFERIKKNS
ncbi:HU family DNA-binding protein [Ornithobacterium rhinotracheale]|uniref:HU family DNA-binding protein n=1 Tax=Ornithobacterium rhinotracheale TaxID=28251 RepID=UPI003873CB87